jgi:hypothetical protein
MRGKGINYDTGFLPGDHDSRPVFDQAVVAAEMRIMARELGCTAVRVSGSKPERISVAAHAAAAEGLEVWFAPYPPEPTTASYGLVSMLPEGPGSGYQDLGWRPRLAFEAMAKLKAG